MLYQLSYSRVQYIKQNKGQQLYANNYADNKNRNEHLELFLLISCRIILFEVKAYKSNFCLSVDTRSKYTNNRKRKSYEPWTIERLQTLAPSHLEVINESTVVISLVKNHILKWLW